jgi:hypothetical protein
MCKDEFDYCTITNAGEARRRPPRHPVTRRLTPVPPALAPSFLAEGIPVALIPPRLRASLIGFAVVAASAAAMAMHAAPAGAAVVCPEPTSHPFAQFGDGTPYALAPNGGLEAGAAGWKLAGGAKVVAGNEAFFASGPGASSLSLPAGSSATSPPMCVGLLDTKMRFFAANAGAASSKLRVQVVYSGGVGALLGGLGQTLGVSDKASEGAGAAWAPMPMIDMLGGTLPLFTQSVQFTFTPLGTGGKWRIDDVYLDPLMHR